MSGYWEQITGRRISRRRALVTAGSAGIAAASSALIGCGGGGTGGTGGGTSKDASGLITPPKDTTSAAKSGGTYGSFVTADPGSLDPVTGTATASRTHGTYVYSRLLQFKPGVLGPSKGEVVGDLVDSWEVLNGGQQITFKLRQDVKFDARPPTNSRTADASDVKYSWDKFAALGSRRGDVIRSATTAGPVESLETPDGRTVVVKLATPYSPILSLLASTFYYYVLPKEAEGGFDPRGDSRGSSAWMLDSYKPSQAIEYKRNPNWYRKDRPFLDGWSQPIISDYSQQLAQFRAGTLWSDVVQSQDILQTKKDLPRLLLQAGDSFNTSLPHVMYGFAEGSPFRDERMRQAVSLSIDRDLIMETFANSANFKAAGLNVPRRVASHIASGWDGFWLDPDSKDFGPNAKYLKVDIAEAKKLIEAAGFKNGVDTDAYYNPTGYGADYVKRVEVVIGMVAEAGIRLKRNEIDYQTEYLPKFALAGKDYGKYKGLSFATGGASAEPGVWVFAYYHTGGSTFHLDPSNNAEMNSLVEQQLKEFDPQKRVAIFQDIQRKLAQNQLITPINAETTGFSLAWPWVGNYGVFKAWVGQSAPAVETRIHLWYDAAQRQG